MHRLGSNMEKAREMVLDDILRCRIELLIFMAKNYLAGAHLGVHQRQAMEKNAVHIETECYSIMAYIEKAQNNDPACLENDLYHHIKLLAIMIKSVAKGYPMDVYRKETMQTNVDAIITILNESGKMEIKFLNVA